MDFKDLKTGDSVYILENTGTFRKITTYNIGTVLNVSPPYDDNSLGNQYMSSVLKKKLVDITITCDGMQKKLTVGADKSTITDSTIGLTISSNKDDLVNQVTAQCKEYESKIASIEIYRAEVEKCKNILSKLKDISEPTGDNDVQVDSIKVS